MKKRIFRCKINKEKALSGFLSITTCDGFIKKYGSIDFISHPAKGLAGFCFVLDKSSPSLGKRGESL